VIGRAIREFHIPRDKLVLMTKAWGVTLEEQAMAYPIMGKLRTSKDYINQFGKGARYPRVCRMEARSLRSS
jgi:aryl-alcohol dehydrogenase-like predicted oxidoreductase